MLGKPAVWLALTTIAVVPCAWAAYVPQYKFMGPAGATAGFWAPGGYQEASGTPSVSIEGSGSAAYANLATGKVGARINQTGDMQSPAGYGPMLGS